MEAIPHSKRSADRIYKPHFKWGESRGDGGTDNEVLFYNSFTYDGVDYSLYDSVYLHTRNDPEPYIGKLVKIWEAQDQKHIRVVWFFRPIEIPIQLGDVALENEIFLACGKGEGLLNDNPLEVLVGKCNVVCTSKDSRNPKPSEEEVRKADYIFYRTFDVGKSQISDVFGDTINGIEVRNFFNKTGHQNDNWETDFSSELNLANAEVTMAQDGKPGVQTNPSVKGVESKRKGHVSDEKIWSRVTTSGEDAIKTRKIQPSQAGDERKQIRIQDSLYLEASDCSPSKRIKPFSRSVTFSEKLETNVSDSRRGKEVIPTCRRS